MVLSKVETNRVFRITNETDYYCNKALIFVDQGKYKEAICILKLSMQGNIRSVDADKLLAEVYSRIGLNILALNTLLNIFWRFEKTPDKLYYWIGEQHILLEDFDSAFNCFDMYQKLEGHIKNDENEHINKLRSFLNNNVVRQMIEEENNELGYLASVLKKGEELIVQDKRDQAIKLYLAEYDKNDLNITIGINLAFAYWKEKRVPEAIALCRELLDVESYNTRVICLMIILHHEMGDEFSKRRCFNEIAEIEYLGINDTIEVADIYFGIGEYERAAVMLDSALKFDCFNIKLIHKVAVARCFLNDKTGAMNMFLRILDVDSDNIVAFYYYNLLKKVELKHIEEQTKRDMFGWNYDLPSAEIEYIGMQLKKYVEHEPFLENSISGFGELSFDQIIKWALRRRDQEFRELALYSAGMRQNNECEVALREFLVSDADNRLFRILAVDALITMGASGPYHFWNGKNLEKIDQGDQLTKRFV